MTISELQQKLMQLTAAQPSELSSTTPPIGSHPSTPHAPNGHYDSYMNSLQKKLTSISMPTGNILVCINCVLCLLRSIISKLFVLPKMFY